MPTPRVWVRVRVNVKIRVRVSQSDVFDAVFRRTPMYIVHKLSSRQRKPRAVVRADVYINQLFVCTNNV